MSLDARLQMASELTRHPFSSPFPSRAPFLPSPAGSTPPSQALRNTLPPTQWYDFELSSFLYFLLPVNLRLGPPLPCKLTGPEYASGEGLHSLGPAGVLPPRSPRNERRRRTAGDFRHVPHEGLGAALSRRPELSCTSRRWLCFRSC